MKGYEIIKQIKEVPTSEVVVKLDGKEYEIKDVHWMGYLHGGKMEIRLEED